jgi:tetratricopeptide (TPR) repeat protein
MKRLGIAIILMTTIAAWFGSGRSSEAMDSTPSPVYYAAFREFYDGDYLEAMDIFQSGLRGATRVGTMPWLDSICYQTMIGECFYKMGKYPQAMDCYAAALTIHLSYPDWFGRLSFMGPTQPMMRGGAPWGGTARGTTLARYPDEIGYRVDQLGIMNQGVDQQVVQSYETRLFHGGEIVRCILLSMRRRMEILGPLSQYDPLTDRVLADSEAIKGVPNHWSQAWVDSVKAVALLAAARFEEAEPLLASALTAAGQYDHAFTSTILYEQGQLALALGNFDAALLLFREASIASYYYIDGTMLEDSLRMTVIAYIAAGKPDICPVIAPAMLWAQVNDQRAILVAMQEALAQNQAARNLPQEAIATVGAANLMIGRLPMRLGIVGAQLDYILATSSYQMGKSGDGDSAMEAALANMQRCSLWLFRLRQLEMQYLGGNITAQGPITLRGAMELYTTLLRDPTERDWLTQPLESLTLLRTPHSLAYGHWFLIALQRGNHELAFEIADRGRRHRFYNTLGWGGRLLSLRLLLESPVEELTPEELLQRQTFLSRSPEYTALIQESNAIQAELEAFPLMPQETTVANERNAGLTRLENVSTRKEELLRKLVCRREHIPLIFPPVRSLEEIRERLPAGHAMLIFYAVGDEMYAYLLDDENYDMWRIASVSNVNRLVINFLHAIGHYDANRSIPIGDLSDTSWKTSARDLLYTIMAGSQADFSQEFPELVIVPDGALWYVPFEALQVQVAEDQFQPLITRCPIRYAPTASLGVPRRSRGRALTVDTFVEIGKLSPRQDEEIAQEAFLQMRETIPRLVPAMYGATPEPTSVFGSLLKQLVVLDEISLGSNPYTWTPITTRRDGGCRVGDWMAAPSGAPRLVVLPGFRTTAEDGLKRMNPSAPGSEMFLSTCAMMASGVDSIILTRWRTGGGTTFDLVREFLETSSENETLDVATAWREAVYAVVPEKIRLEDEPRIASGPRDEAPTAAHPFLWAAFMPIDMGYPDPDQPDPSYLENPLEGEGTTEGEGGMGEEGEDNGEPVDPDAFLLPPGPENPLNPLLPELPDDPDEGEMNPEEPMDNQPLVPIIPDGAGETPPPTTPGGDSSALSGLDPRLFSEIPIEEGPPAGETPPSGEQEEGPMSGETPEKPEVDEDETPQGLEMPGMRRLGGW